MSNFTLRIAPEMMDQLMGHLFPGDRDEHGAVIAASVVESPTGTRLLAHKLFLAEDGVDYVPGQRGYRMLTADFVMDSVIACADLKMAYLAIHCHGGDDRVGFSTDDLSSHERGYQALLDIVDGPPVGGLVFARNAVAGDIWLPGGARRELAELIVPGRPLRRLYDQPPAAPASADERYDRQARLFGDRGQAILREQRVGVIGAGGAGSLIVEYLSRLGVGELVVADPDLIESTNLSRVVGSRVSDLGEPRWPWLPGFLRSLFMTGPKAKVAIAERLAREAQPGIVFEGVQGDVTDAAVAERFINCDYLFLAADSAQARLVYNALVHQYLIPGVQVGAKAQVEQSSGEVVDLFTVVRPSTPGRGCLWCNGLISPAKLQGEATEAGQRRRQRYVDDDEIAAPSVITLNSMAAARATNDYLMSMLGLLEPGDLTWTREDPRTGEVITEYPRQGTACRECGPEGRFAKGGTAGLPVSARGGA